MHINLYINSFGDYLKRRYGESVHKISLHGNFTCPNRDGTLGRGGCTFCNVNSFAGESSNKTLLLEEQLACRSGKSFKYLAYFQAYTSTYAEQSILEQMYNKAINATDVVGLCVGTRPDCVSDSVLQLLASYQKQGYEIWLELGLQSAIDDTLDIINRGHHFKEYAITVKKARDLGIKVCTHLIIGLPTEELIHNMTTLQLVLDEGVDALKLHQLHIVKGSRMASQYKKGEIEVLELDEYCNIAAKLIQNTPKNILFERVSASTTSDMLIAPLWSTKRWPPINKIGEILEETGVQGSALGDPFVFEPIILKKS
ncbi:MAG: TIGR01212 family radical SAM protein [Succinivibrionaceae bacterium]